MARLKVIKLQLAVVILLGISGTAQAESTGDSDTIQFAIGHGGVRHVTVGAREDATPMNNQLFDLEDRSPSMRSNPLECGQSSPCNAPANLKPAELDLDGNLHSVTVTTSVSGVTTIVDKYSVDYTWSEQSVPISAYLLDLSEDITLKEQMSLPNPATVVLILAGLLGLTMAGRRRKA